MIGPGRVIVCNNMTHCVPKLYGFRQLILLKHPIINIQDSLLIRTFLPSNSKRPSFGQFNPII